MESLSIEFIASGVRPGFSNLEYTKNKIPIVINPKNINLLLF